MTAKLPTVTLPESVNDLPVAFNIDPANMPAELAAFLQVRSAGRTAGLWSRFIVGPERMAPADQATLDAMKEARDAEMRKREESFERCDNDGFLTQWAHGLTAQKHQVAAELASNGGFDLFPGLFDRKTGARVPAIQVHGEWGCYWRLCDPKTGRFLHGRESIIPDTRGPTGGVARRGFVVLGEWARAEAVVRSIGTGLSGRAWACAERTDNGYPGRP